MKKIVIGSDNPVKVAAVKKVVRKIWPQAKVISLKVDSGIRSQPLSDQEAIKGAENRAQKVLAATKADLAFGLEGCTIEIKNKMFVSGWASAIDRHGQRSLGSSGRLLLPEKIAQAIRQGGELGPVMDKFFKKKNLKKKQGAAGILTDNLVTRSIAFETAIIFSLAPFLKPQYYRS